MTLRILAAVLVASVIATAAGQDDLAAECVAARLECVTVEDELGRGDGAWDRCEPAFRFCQCATKGGFDATCFSVQTPRQAEPPPREADPFDLGDDLNWL